MAPRERTLQRRDVGVKEKQELESSSVRDVKISTPGMKNACENARGQTG